LQRAVDAVVTEKHALLGSFDPHFWKLWKKGARLK
jgi:hypothetical protein